MRRLLTERYIKNNYVDEALILNSRLLFLVTIISGCVSMSSFHELHSEGLKDLKFYRFEWALESFLEAEKMDSNHKYLQHDIAYTLFKLGRYEDSIVYTNKILSNEPNNIKAIKRKALSYRRLAKYDQSSDLYEKAIDIDNDDYYAVSNIARNRCDQMKYNMCIDAIRKFRGIVAAFDRTVIPEREKELIRKIEKSMLALESTAKLGLS